MTTRAEYVQALQNERAMVAARPGASKERLTAIDAALARFASEPADAPGEAAVPGPISAMRKKRVKRTPEAPSETPAEAPAAETAAPTDDDADAEVSEPDASESPSDGE